MSERDAPNYRPEKRKCCPTCIYSKWVNNAKNFRCVKYDIAINSVTLSYYICDSYYAVGSSFFDRFKLKIFNKLWDKKNAAR